MVCARSPGRRPGSKQGSRTNRTGIETAICRARPSRRSMFPQRRYDCSRASRSVPAWLRCSQVDSRACPFVGRLPGHRTPPGLVTLTAKVGSVEHHLNVLRTTDDHSTRSGGLAIAGSSAVMTLVRSITTTALGPWQRDKPCVYYLRDVCLRPCQNLVRRSKNQNAASVPIA
jgi:hypothetical protein